MADPGHGGMPGPDHARHDPELIAALLDDDLPGPERARGEARIAACSACARLHHDLLTLARAARTEPAPARPRDFRLTPADAARLGALSAHTDPPGEPLVATTRLIGDMTDLRTASTHATHDTMLVASLADHSLAPDDRAAAERLVAGCSLCAALHDDLLAIRAATIELPTPARRRDYQLTEADAAKLQRAGWRRWVAAFGSPRDAFSRPLAIGLTTLGIVGILVGGAPLLLQGSATSGGPTTEQAVGSAGAAAGAGAGAPVAPPQADNSAPEVTVGAPAATPAPAAAAPSAAAPAATSREFLADQGRSSETSPGGAKASTGAGLTNPVDAMAAHGQAPVEPGSGVPPLLVVSGALLLVGMALFLLRWTARRFGA